MYVSSAEEIASWFPFGDRATFKHVVIGAGDGAANRWAGIEGINAAYMMHLSQNLPLRALEEVRSNVARLSADGGRFVFYEPFLAPNATPNDLKPAPLCDG